MSAAPSSPVRAPLLHKLLLAQESRMSRVALLVVYWCGLDREPLRQIQWRDINLETGSIAVTWRKRLGEITVPAHVLEMLRVYAAERTPRPTDYLLHYERRHRRGTWPSYRFETIAKPERRLSASGVFGWWRRCVCNAGLEHFPMSEFRRAPGEQLPEPVEPSVPPVPAEPMMGGRPARLLAQTAVFLRRVADRLDALSRELHSAAAARAVRETAVVIAEHVSVTLRRTPPRNSA